MSKTLERKGIYMVKTVNVKGVQKKFVTRIGVAHFQEDGVIDLDYDAQPCRNDGTTKTVIMDKKAAENKERD